MGYCITNLEKNIFIEKPKKKGPYRICDQINRACEFNDRKSALRAVRQSITAYTRKQMGNYHIMDIEEAKRAYNENILHLSTKNSEAALKACSTSESDVSLLRHVTESESSLVAEAAGAYRSETTERAENLESFLRSMISLLLEQESRREDIRSKIGVLNKALCDIAHLEENSDDENISSKTGQLKHNILKERRALKNEYNLLGIFYKIMSSNCKGELSANYFTEMINNALSKDYSPRVLPEMFEENNIPDFGDWWGKVSAS